MEASMASLSLSYANPNLQSPELPFAILRQWRPNAQRNLRNQWSKLSALRNQWSSSSSSARSHATSLVNTFLSSRYLDKMDLGVLNDMPNIREKTLFKLLKQQELQVNQLLSLYKSMVGIVVDMANLSKSMRCFLKEHNGSPLIQFSNTETNSNDTGDGGGVPVFTFLSIYAFETLAGELLEMFKQELLLKRLLVVELVSVTSRKHDQFDQLSWADELYHGEDDHLSICDVYSKEIAEPCLPKLDRFRSETTHVESDKNPSSEILQVYLTTWLAEVNINTYRVEEIFATVGEEMRISFS
ncbi:hypothetical protein RND81_13G112300 [Saponaria officinalis]|uniref:Uncharacterized protein n=1 Tax=Saponaria officinalis TaxID=3572 RepID=A0AAW1H215_SAPOF